MSCFPLDLDDSSSESDTVTLILPLNMNSTTTTTTDTGYCTVGAINIYFYLIFQMFTRTCHYERCIEVGTLSGYISMATALAVPDNGLPATLDINDKYI